MGTAAHPVSPGGPPSSRIPKSVLPWGLKKATAYVLRAPVARGGAIVSLSSVASRTLVKSNKGNICGIYKRHQHASRQSHSKASATSSQLSVGAEAARTLQAPRVGRPYSVSLGIIFLHSTKKSAEWQGKEYGDGEDILQCTAWKALQYTRHPSTARGSSLVVNDRTLDVRVTSDRPSTP